MRFVIACNTMGFSGYSKAVRELGYALNQKGIETVIPYRGNMDYIPEKCYPLLRARVQAQNDDVTFIRPYSEDVRAFSGANNLIGNLALESTKLPERMVRECNMDVFKQIWVPSKHVYDTAVANNIIEDKLRVVPHGYDPNIFKFKNKAILSPYTFLFVGGYTGKGDRKGADILAQAFHEEFKEDDVKLIFKINTCYGNFPIEDLALNEKIRFSTDFLLDCDMSLVYNSGDCFVAPSWGEAFNMTLLEAMAIGLPIITTDWGGHMDFVNDNKDERVEIDTYGEFVPARYSPHDTGLWKRPNKNTLKQCLRSMYVNQPKRKRYKNISNWTWWKASGKALKYLEEL